MTMGANPAQLPTKTTASAERARIAIFQAFWRLHSNAVYSARILADAGYDVDLFLFGMESPIPICSMDGLKGITVHSLNAGADPFNSRANRHFLVHQLLRVFLRLPRRAWMVVWNRFLLLAKSDRGLVPRDVLKRTAKIINGQQYKAFIGIEKGGLIWAGAIARKQPTVLIYWSLELYTRNHPFISNILNRRRKAAEEVNHNRCWATVVQDPMRAKVLLDDNRISHQMRMLYVPISRMGGCTKRQSQSWRRRLGIRDDEIVILSHGMIADRRLCAELAHCAQTFSDAWVLVFHGFGDDETIKRIFEIDRRGKVRLSLDLVDQKDEPEIMGSANISLVLYQKYPDNDCLTGFSSEKLALSLQCGIPIIAFNYPSFHHIREQGCGILVDDLSEIPKAASQILTEYGHYSSRAHDAFNKYFRFEKNFEKVLRAFDELN